MVWSAFVFIKWHRIHETFGCGWRDVEDTLYGDRSFFLYGHIHKTKYLSSNHVPTTLHFLSFFNENVFDSSRRILVQPSHSTSYILMTFTCYSLLGKVKRYIIFSRGLSIINTGLLIEVNLEYTYCCFDSRIFSSSLGKFSYSFSASLSSLVLDIFLRTQRIPPRNCD